MTSPIPIRDESGTALVEFALVLPVLMVLILGIVDFGRAINSWIDSTHLANVTARYAAVNQNPGAPLGQTLQQYMEKQTVRTTKTQQTPADVCIVTTGNVGDPVKVTVSSEWSWLGYLVERAHLAPKTSIRGSATMRLEAKPTAYSAGCT